MLWTATRLVVLALGVALAPLDARGAPAPAFDGWEVEYALVGKVRISDTTMGAGDGTHDVGPGIVVLRFDDVAGEPGGRARVSRFELTMRFTVDAYVLGIGTTVLHETVTRASPNGLGFIAEGRLGSDRVIRWAGPWANVGTEGHQTCSGSMCSKFGAPPAGRSVFHIAPHPMTLNPFTLSPNKKALRMDYVVMDKKPSHTSRLLLQGSERRRTRVRATGANP